MLEGCVPWPDAVAGRYRARGYWQPRTIPQTLRETAARHPERTALVAGDRRWTWRDLDAAADRVAYRLRETGLVPGDRAIFQLPNIPEFVMAWYGCLRAGLIPVTCLAPFRQTEIGYLAAHTEARAYFIASEVRGFDHVRMAEEMRAGVPSLEHVFVAGERRGPGMRDLAECITTPVPPARVGKEPVPGPTEAAVFQLSGGTTGVPKVIPRTHEDYLYNSRALCEVMRFGPDSVYLCVLPIPHNASVILGLHTTLLTGARFVLAPDADPGNACRLIEAERVTHMMTVPAVLQNLLNTPARRQHDWSSLVSIICGGQKVKRELAERVHPETGTRIQQIFGMGEGLCMLSRLDDPDDIVLESVGRPISDADELRIVDPETGRDVPFGEEGELWCRGPYTVPGYYRAPEHNATVFTPDGFYRTGDIARAFRAPSTGTVNYVIEGRIKDLINRGAEKINAEEVEGHLLHHPAIREAVVVAVPDPLLGERACACIVPGAGASPPSLDDLCAFLETRQLAKFKWPEWLEVFAAIPLTRVGKHDKAAVRAEVARRRRSS